MKQLKFQYCSYIVVTLLLVFFYESGLATEGILAHDTVMSYRFEYVMEILTICMIPLALKLFSFKKIKARLVEDKEKALIKYGIIRIMMLGIPLLLNTIFYYIYLGVAFGYLAIILLISMVFITPTKARCEDEITSD